jgi:hypothetical protein
MGIVLVAEGDLIILKAGQAMIGNGHPVSVAGEIVQHMAGTAKGRLGVYEPVLTEKGSQEGTERLLVFEWFERSRESELALLKSSL